MSAEYIGDGRDILLSSELLEPSQHIICTVACDDLGGTAQVAELTPKLAPSWFPFRPTLLLPTAIPLGSHLNHSQRRSKTDGGFCRASDLVTAREDHFDDDISDSDFVAAENAMDFQDVEGFKAIEDVESAQQKRTHPLYEARKLEVRTEEAILQRLENGNWPCHHKCKNKPTCKHLCCREGTERLPRSSRHTDSSKTQRPVILKKPDQVKLSFKSYFPRPIKFRTPRPFDGDGVEKIDLSLMDYDDDVEDDIMSPAVQMMEKVENKCEEKKAKQASPRGDLMLTSADAKATYRDESIEAERADAGQLEKLGLEDLEVDELFAFARNMELLQRHVPPSNEKADDYDDIFNLDDEMGNVDQLPDVTPKRQHTRTSLPKEDPHDHMEQDDDIWQEADKEASSSAIKRCHSTSFPPRLASSVTITGDTEPPSSPSLSKRQRLNDHLRGTEVTADQTSTSTAIHRQAARLEKWPHLNAVLLEKLDGLVGESALDDILNDFGSFIDIVV